MFTSLRARLTGVCVAATAVSLLGLAGASYVATKNQQQQALEAQVTGAANTNTALLSTWVHGKLRAGEVMREAALAADPMPLLKASVIAGDSAVSFLGYPDKRYIFSDPQGIASDYDPTVRPWYVEAVKAGNMVISGPYVSTAGETRGKLVITVAAPVYVGSTLKAVFGATTSLEQVMHDVAAIKPTANSYAVLVDQKGKILAAPSPNLALKPATELSPTLDAAVIGQLTEGHTLREANINGRDVYLRATKVTGTNWILLIAFDKSDVTAGTTALLRTSAILTIIALALAACGVGMLVSRMLRRLNQVRDAMQDVASGEGDITIRIPDAGKDELAQISRAYNQFADKLGIILRGIRQTSESVKGGATEIAAGNLDLSSRTEQQAAALEETAASMEELTSAVRQSAENAQQASQLAALSSASAETGGTVMARVMDTMGDINASSKRISEITGVIDGIAFQTNILALNAAVEAARAGEAGRGFAVVAAEVRTLAQRSAQAAKEIKGLITESGEKVAHGAQLVEKASSAMNEIVHRVNRVTDITGEITAAAQEQNAGIGQVNDAISQMDAVTQQNAALVEEAAAAANSLREQSEQLAAAVAQFKLD